MGREKRRALCQKIDNSATRLSGEGDPALVDEQFDGPVLGLVVHLAAILDPVAQVDGLQTQAFGLGDLPEDRVASQAALLFVGIVEGIDGRESVRQHVRHGYGQQAAMQAELEEAAEGQVADQEGGELVAAGRIHVAVGVALLDVAPIEVVVLLVEARSLADHLQFRIALEDAPLLAVRAEAGDRYARGDAGGAMLAVRTIEMVAAAAEADLRQRGVQLRVHGLAGIEEQGGCLLLGQVAARVRLRRVELQSGEFGHGELQQGPISKFMPGTETRLKIQVAGRRLVAIALQVVGEFPPADGAGAQAVQVAGRHLAVDEDEAGVAQMADQRDEADLGSVVGAAEHRFAEEQPAHGQAVEAADQLSLLPDLHGVGNSAQVQLLVGQLHRRGDPGAVGVVTRRGTSLDHRPEVTVESDFEALLAQALGQAAGNVQFVGEQDGARVGRPPEDRLAILVPGEAAVAIGCDQALRIEVAAGREQPVGLLQGLVEGRKVEVGAGKPGQHGGVGEVR